MSRLFAVMSLCVLAVCIVGGYLRVAYQALRGSGYGLEGAAAFGHIGTLAWRSSGRGAFTLFNVGTFRHVQRPREPAIL